MSFDQDFLNESVPKIVNVMKFMPITKKLDSHWGTGRYTVSLAARAPTEDDPELYFLDVDFISESGSSLTVGADDADEIGEALGDHVTASLKGMLRNSGFSNVPDYVAEVRVCVDGKEVRA